MEMKDIVKRLILSDAEKVKENLKEVKVKEKSLFIIKVFEALESKIKNRDLKILSYRNDELIIRVEWTEEDVKYLDSLFVKFDMEKFTHNGWRLYESEIGEYIVAYKFPLEEMIKLLL